jgi:uncharacterized membrane protein YhaH (DUF805 family)
LILEGRPFAVGGLMLVMLFVVLTAPANISLQVRRLHDVGLSGWWLLIAIVPYIFEILYIDLIIILCFLVIDLLPSTVGPNKYGKNT